MTEHEAPQTRVAITYALGGYADRHLLLKHWGGPVQSEEARDALAAVVSQAIRDGRIQAIQVSAGEPSGAIWGLLDYMQGDAPVLQVGPFTRVTCETIGDLYPPEDPGEGSVVQPSQ